MDYSGLTLLNGELCISYVVLQTFPEGLSPEQVEVEFLKPFELPEELVTYKKRIIEKKRSEAEKEGRLFFNGPLVRLSDYSSNEGKQLLKLVLQPTDFFSYSTSNKSLEKPIEELGGKTIRECFDLKARELDDVLSNPIGVNTALLTEDKKVIVVKRGKKLSQYPGLYGVLPAGFMEPEDGTPFKTAAREGREEVGDFTVQVKLYELGRALDDLHFEIGMVGKICTDSQQIIKVIESPEWEAGNCFMVPFNPRDCAHYMAERTIQTPDNVPPSAWVEGKSPAWVPAHFRILYLALLKEYGQEELHKELKKILRSDD